MMRKISIASVALLFFTACDNRPSGVYEQGNYQSPIDVKKINVDGIEYLHFNDRNTEGVDGIAVNFAQFFENDTIYVNGYVWVNIGSEEEIRKEQRVPIKQEQP